MSYQSQKPFGRRKTDKPLSEEERRQFQTIRRDVDEDPTGQIRRYMRLASKALDPQSNESTVDNPVLPRFGFQHAKNRAA